MKTTTISSFEREISGEDESRRRAETADSKPKIEPEIVNDIPKQEPQFTIDPTKMHALMVRIVKGTVLRIDQKMNWTVHPDDQWCETTTEALEIVLEKWIGAMASSPEVLLAFNIGIGWILPNLLASMEKEESAAAAARAASNAEKQPPF